MKGKRNSTADERAHRIKEGAIFRTGLQLSSAEEGARRIKRLMRRAEGRSTVNCVELWERMKGPGQEEQFSGKTKEM